MPGVRQTDLPVLRDMILKLAEQFPVGRKVRDVQVRTDDDGVGGEYLKVQFEMNDLDAIKPADVEPLIEMIEESVAEKDDRFASVFFADAA